MERQLREQEEAHQQQVQELHVSTEQMAADDRRIRGMAAAREQWMQSTTATYHNEMAALRVYEQLAFQYGTELGKPPEAVRREAVELSARAQAFLSTPQQAAATMSPPPVAVSSVSVAGRGTSGPIASPLPAAAFVFSAPRGRQTPSRAQRPQLLPPTAFRDPTAPHHPFDFRTPPSQ